MNREPAYKPELVPFAKEYILKDKSNYSKHFVDVTPKELHVSKSGAILTKVMRNKDFLVQFYQEPNKPLRLSISRTSLQDDGHWEQNITWDELQYVKNKVGFSMEDAVEIYPRSFDVVDVANIRHLWIVGDVDFRWRKE